MNIWSFLAGLSGRGRKRERVGKYERHVVLPAEVNCLPCRRAEERRKKQALWAGYTVSGNPSGWPRWHYPAPRRARRDRWRHNEKADKWSVWL